MRLSSLWLLCKCCTAQGWRGKKISEEEEKEFFRRARALNIRVSPYFRRSKARTGADAE